MMVRPVIRMIVDTPTDYLSTNYLHLRAAEGRSRAGNGSGPYVLVSLGTLYLIR